MSRLSWISQTQTSPARSSPRILSRVTSASALKSASIPDNGVAIYICLDKYTTEPYRCIFVFADIRSVRHVRHSAGCAREVRRHRELGQGVVRGATNRLR